MSLDPLDSTVVSIVPSTQRVGDGTAGPGRPKGSRNKTGETTRFWLAQIVEGEMINVHKALRDVLQGTPPMYDALTGKQVRAGVPPNPAAYIKALTDLTDFCLPRLTRVEVKDERVPLAEVDIPKDATQEDAALAYLTLVKG